MSVGSRIKELREEKGLTRTELAKLLNVTVSAISNYENEISSPKEPVLFKIIETFGCDANYLFQDVVKIKERINDVTLAEYEHIKKYRFISQHSPENADMIDIAIDKGYSVAKQISQQKNQISAQQDHINQLEQRIVTEVAHRIAIPLYGKFASAGDGAYLFDDIPTEKIRVPDTPIAHKADFVIGVNGDSMEPDYCDGEKVFVEKTSDLNIGDIGIFLKGSDCYIKECGPDRLISKNKAYDDIWPDESIITIGKVIGKVEED